MADISKMEEKLKSYHAMLRGSAARLEQQSRAATEAIARLQLGSATARLMQRYAEMEGSFSIPSATEQLRRTTLQLPDFARVQFELDTSLRLSQEARESIENLFRTNRSIIEQFATQTTRNMQKFGAAVAKSLVDSVIKQFGADRAVFDRLATQMEQQSQLYKDLKLSYLDSNAIERLQTSRIDAKLPSFDFSIVELLRQMNVDLKTPLMEAFAFNQSTRAVIESIAAQATQHQRAVTATLDQLQITSHLPRLLEISPDGEVTLGGESASALEVNEAVEGLFSLIRELDFFDSLYERLKEFKTPVQVIVLWILDKVLFVIFLSVISNMLTPYIQSYFDQFLFKSRREVTQAIKKMPYEVNINNFTAFRVVTGDRLRLRAKPSMEARILDELRRGKLVRVIEKRRNWTLVEVQYEDADKPLLGWVATRHIAVLRR